MPFSIIMTTKSRRQNRSTIDAFVATDMYTRLLVELLEAQIASHAELWICCPDRRQFMYRGVTVRLMPEFTNVDAVEPDVLFVRGDKKVHVPLLRSLSARRTLFYGASTRGIPRYWSRFHGILVDDIGQESVVRRYYPGAYVGEFLKTAPPDIFHPLPNEAKQFDVCIVANMASPHKKLVDMIDVVRSLPDVTFVICGSFDADMERRLGGRPGQVTCKGIISRPELNRVFNQSRLAVVPSGHTDAAPRVLLEFMAAGLPMLINEQLCGAAKFVNDEVGVLAPTSRLAELIPDMLASLDHFNPLDAFVERFSPACVARNFAGHVEAVLRMPDKPPGPSIAGRLSRLCHARIDKHAR